MAAFSWRGEEEGESKEREVGRGSVEGGKKGSRREGREEGEKRKEGEEREEGKRGKGGGEERAKSGGSTSDMKPWQPKCQERTYINHGFGHLLQKVIPLAVHCLSPLSIHI